MRCCEGRVSAARLFVGEVAVDLKREARLMG